MDNRCISCGEIIPEGIQVCGICEENNKCAHAKNHVAEVRRLGDETYRRKICKACGMTYYTVEFEVEYNNRFCEDWKNARRGTVRKKHE